MPAVIATNTYALNTQGHLARAEGGLRQSLQRLSSGLRINGAADDAAGIAISDRLQAQTRGMSQAGRNLNDGISMLQTAEAGLSSATDILQRMRELAVQSANGSNTTLDRQALQKEVSQLAQELDRIATVTQFNGKNLLDGSLQGEQFQVGANASQTVSASISSARGRDLGVHVNEWSGRAYSTVSSVTGGIGITGNGVTTPVVSYTISDSADTNLQMALAINTYSSQTGVVVVSEHNSYLSSLSTAGTVSFDLKAKNGAVSRVVATIVDPTDLSPLAAAINETSAVSGITAAATGGTINLNGLLMETVRITNYSHSAGGTLSTRGDFGAAVALSAGQTFVGLSNNLHMRSNGQFSWVNGAGAVRYSAQQTVSAGDISTQSGAVAAMVSIDAALQQVSQQRASLGALQNRFGATVGSLQTMVEQASAAKSRIVDADYAQEMANFTRRNILQQGANMMLAQANQLPRNVLNLLN